VAKAPFPIFFLALKSLWKFLWLIFFSNSIAQVSVMVGWLAWKVSCSAQCSLSSLNATGSPRDSSFWMSNVIRVRMSRWFQTWHRSQACNNAWVFWVRRFQREWCNYRWGLIVFLLYWWQNYFWVWVYLTPESDETCQNGSTQTGVGWKITFGRCYFLLIF